MIIGIFVTTWNLKTSLTYACFFIQETTEVMVISFQISNQLQPTLSAAGLKPEDFDIKRG